jgi:hypothetical protein
MTIRAHPGAQARGQDDRGQVGQRAGQDADPVTMQERHGGHDQRRQQRGGRRDAPSAPVRDGRHGEQDGQDHDRVQVSHRIHDHDAGQRTDRLTAAQ